MKQPNTTTANHQKAKNLKELLNGRINEAYRISSTTTSTNTMTASPPTNHHLQHQCKCLSCSNRYLMMNGVYGTTRYAYRKQQFGRWHEEPAFGSRYAFDNDSPNIQTNHNTSTTNKIGRASCRERVCLHV